MSSGTRSIGSRHWPWLGAAALLVLAVGVWVGSTLSSPPPPQVEPEVPLEAQRPPSPPATPPVAQLPPPRPPAKTPPPPQPAAPSQPGAPPDSTPQEQLPPVDEPPLSDPFEPQGDQESPIRTLVSVGDIQLGVVRNSNIRDEAGLKKTLVRIGDDLQRRIQEQQAQEGAPSPQQVLDSYRDELGKYMDGEVELRGPDWMIGVEVGPPKPREQWWKPRKM